MADSTEDSHDGSKTLSERLEELDRTLADWAPLRWASFKLGVKPSVIAAGCVLWMSCFLLWGFSGELICTLVAYIYPAFASFKALEEAGSGDGTAGIDHWLRYWLTYACSMLAERVLYTLLTWIPFYHLVRLLYIVWLFLPSTNGAQLVYAWAIAPVLRLYRPKLDEVLSKLSVHLADWTPRRNPCAIVVETCAQEENVTVQEIIAQELAKAAVFHVNRVAANTLNAACSSSSSTTERRAVANTISPGARQRVASPAPRAAPAVAASTIGVDAET